MITNPKTFFEQFQNFIEESGLQRVVGGGKNYGVYKTNIYFRSDAQS